MAVPGVEDNSLEAVEFAVVFNTSILLIFFIIFEILLRRPTLRQQLAPRLAAGERIGALISRFPHVLPGGFLAWSANLRRRDRLELHLDAQVLVRFCQLGLKFSLLGTVLSVILIPMYGTGPGHAEGFNALSLSNLKVGGSVRFWCVILAASQLHTKMSATRNLELYSCTMN